MRPRDEPEDLDERGDRPAVDPRAMRRALAVTTAAALPPLPTSVMATRIAPATYHRPEPAPCIVCGQVVSILLALPEERKRSVCGACQGKAVRDRLRALADAVRTLRSSDDAAELERARQTIHRLDNFPTETIELVRSTRAAAAKDEAPKPRRGFK